MQLQIKVNNGIIKKAVSKTFGCGSAIASSSYTTELLHGMHIDKATSIRNSLIAGHLKLPPVKLHCQCWQKIQLGVRSIIIRTNKKNK